MAARGSFQKRKKEAERREKRQVKLDRRQGRQPVGGASSTSEGGDDQNELNPEGIENPGLTAVSAGEDSILPLRPTTPEGA